MSVRLWKRLFSRVGIWALLAIACAALLLLGKATWSVYEKQREAARAYSTEAVAFNALAERHMGLQEKLTALDTQTGIEAELRERFSVAKPGEAVIVLVDTEKATVNVETTVSYSFWQGVLDWLRW